MTRPVKTPLWQAISRSLRDAITARHYLPGDRLPTEAALAERFGVNRHTVRRALRALAEEGLVRSRRGAGTFVAASGTVYPIGPRVRFHQNVLAGGQAPEKRILHIEERPAAAPEAAQLEIAPRAPICICHGLSLADGQPIALFVSHFPAALLPGIAAALSAQTGVSEALRRCGIADYTRRSTRISARAATATQALQLQLTEGAPLAYTGSINVDRDGRVIEYGETWFAGERVTLTIEGAG